MKLLHVTPLLLALPLCFLGRLVAAPVITEIMAANDAAVFDEDGDASDWLEIFNPDPAAVDLGGWSLTDNAANPAKWTFPAGIVLEPGAFLRVWASSKNRMDDPAALHTNFALSADGEYLALVPPGGGAPASAFDPAFPALRDDESYGVPFESTVLVAPEASVLVQAPAAETGTNWRQRDFVPDATWQTVPLSLGFGMPSPGFFIEERLSGAAITSITTAQAVLEGTNALDQLTGLRPVINLVSENGPDHRFSASLPFLHGGAPERFALRARSSITLPAGGQWTFHVNSSDGFALYLGSSLLMSFNGVREAADSLVTRTVPAGTHELRLDYYGNTGLKSVEVSAARGAHQGFSEAFQLIGDTANGGVPALAPGDSGLSMIATDLSAALLNVAASAYVRAPFTLADPATVETLDLTLAYNDGFVAYLNGVEVARRNAPAAPGPDATATEPRDAAASLLPETIPLSAFRPHLVAGENVLAFHALNASAADPSFYLAPELRASRRVPGALRFFSAPTPGRANTAAGTLGRLDAPTAQPPRGYFNAATAVTLTTNQPGAIIRYTTNGSAPTRDNGTTYTTPLALDATTVLRAAAFLEDYETSATATHTYLFLDDVIRQGTTPTRGAKPGPEWPNPGAINGQVIQYGMDPTIVNHTNATIGGEASTLTALRSLPAVCLTVDLPDLFHPTRGIYVNAEEHGRSWERPASMELLPREGDAESGFDSGCGVRMRGGVSRRDSNPKHGWRVFFRKEYGAGKLRYPVYGGAGTDEFDAFDLQCAQNYSWSRDGNTSYNALREIWSRDAQLAMGQPATRGRFVHLYLNGVYWGLHQIQERAIAPFGASYLGGRDEDYDVIKSSGLDGGHTTEATDGYFTTLPDGSDSAWKKLWTASRAAYFINRDKNPAAPATTLLSTPQEKLSAYYKLQGLQADGRTPAGEAPLLDVDNLIDYILLLFFTRNSDSSISAFYDNARPNNFYCLRDRLGALGFVSINHDAEHTFDASGAADRWGPWQTDTGNYWNNINYSNPQYIHQDLSASPEYRMRFADRIYRHFFNDGALTTAQNLARFDARAAEIEQAVVAESARWGDAQATPARTVANWRTARTATRNAINGRYTPFLNEARTRGFYPTVTPPALSPRGGLVTPDTPLTFTPGGGSGVIYYTTDGTDPRPAGGGFDPQVLTPEFADASYLVPSETNGGSTLTLAQWTTPAAPPNAAAWGHGPLGFGFVPAGRPATTDFTPFIKTDLKALLQPEGGTAHGTFYVRLSFTLTESQLAAISTLRLKLRYDDAFIAYLNGAEVARRTVGAAFVPAWNSTSGSSRTDANAVTQDVITFAIEPGMLVAGENMLAFHVMNSTATNNDMLFSPQVEFDTFAGALGQVYSGPFTLTRGGTVKARVLDGTTWSALEEAEFTLGTTPAVAAHLVVSEFCYAPAAPRTPAEAAYEAAEFEFVELLNISPYTLDLAGVRFSEAIEFTFPAGPESLLPPGGRLVVSPNLPAFALRYGPLARPVTGPYSGKLNNSGETIRLWAADQSVIKAFAYGPQAPWPAAANSSGHSLVLRAPLGNSDHADPLNWRASAAPDGNPAAPDDEVGLTYAAWKAAHGFTDDTADPYQTGLPLFAAYAFGASDTWRGGDVPPVAGLMADPEGHRPTLTFRRRLATDAIFHLESSASLQTASWTDATDAFDLVSETPHDDGTATVIYRARQPLAPGPLFLRVRVTGR